MSLLHTGSEVGREESKRFFAGVWKVVCETRAYELEDGTRVEVTVFMADFVEGMEARTGLEQPGPVTGVYQLTGAYQYAVQVEPAEGYERPVRGEYGDLDKSRLTPAVWGETRRLLAWEAALDEAERLLG